VRIGFGVVCLASFLFVAAPSAIAQVFQGPTATDDRPAVEVSVEALMDTNVARSDEAEAAARGLKQDDWIYTPQVTLNLTRPIGPESLFLSGNVGYDLYQNNSILNRERLDLQGGAKGQFGLCSATLTGGADRHQSNLEDINIATPVVRNTQELNSVGLDGSCGRPIGFGVEASVTQSWASNSTPQFRTFDSRQLTTTLALIYQRPNFGKLSLFGQYDTADYPNDLVLAPTPTGDSYNLYAGGIRFERDLGARLAATISLAYTSLTPLQGAGFSGFTYSGDLTYRFSGKLSAHLRAERAAQPAVLNDAAYVVDQHYRAEGDYSLGARLMLTAGVSEEVRRYGGLTLAPTLEINNERLEDVYATARIAFARRLYAGLDLRYEVRHGDVAELNYSDAQVGLTVGARF
jgi:Putative beta-barrel porin 2